MKRLVLSIGVAALVLSGCNSSSSTRVSDLELPPIPETGVASGVSVAVAGDDDPDIGETTADYDLSTPGQVSFAFDGGALDGRTIVFDTEEDEAVSGLIGDEEGFLTAIISDHSVALLVDIFSDDNDEGRLAALHTGVAPTDMPDAGPVTYTGSFVGVGTDWDVNGGATGTISIDADFNNATVDGTVSNIMITADDGPETATLADVGFVATMSGDKATYSGSTVTIGGVSATGLADGGFYGEAYKETAGGLAAFGDDGAVIGAFGASR